MSRFTLSCIILAAFCFAGGFIQGLNGARITRAVRSLINLVSGIVFIGAIIIAILSKEYFGIIWLFAIYCVCGGIGMHVAQSLWR